MQMGQKLRLQANQEILKISKQNLEQVQRSDNHTSDIPGNIDLGMEKIVKKLGR
jgi:hypothetical protein